MTGQQVYSPDWHRAKIENNATIHDALRAISDSGAMMACAVDRSNKLIGIITDSDVRRHLLRGGSIQDFAGTALNTNPAVGFVDMTSSELAATCKEHDVRELPVCTRSGQLVDIFIIGHSHKAHCLEEVSQPGFEIPNYVFISAGGKGTRLRSVVSDRPKPLALVGNVPLIETVISRAFRVGFSNFYVSVNYMAEMLKEHLQEEKYAHLNISLLQENSPLGTAGAIGFVANDIQNPLLVTNADVLTTVPYREILRAHVKSGAWLTCVVRAHEYTVPFGVVEISTEIISGITEKPTYRWFANSGIYVLSPEACREVRPNQKLDMPELIEIGLKKGKKITPFILHEYWLDVGRPDDFHKANAEFHEHFGAE